MAASTPGSPPGLANTTTIVDPNNPAGRIVLNLFTDSAGVTVSNSTVGTVPPTVSPTPPNNVQSSSDTSSSSPLTSPSAAVPPPSRQASPVSPGPLTTDPTQFITASSSAAATSGAAASSGTPSPKTNSTGFIAGIAVLAALLLLALGVLLSLVLRRNRKKSQYGASEPAYETKIAQEATVTSLENTINSLEVQLHERDNQLRNAQAALLHKAHRAVETPLDDRQINERFAGLAKSINDWVVTHFKTFRPGFSPAPDVARLLEKTQPNYPSLLRDPRLKYLVVRGLVAEVITEAFSTGEFFGNPGYSEVLRAVSAKASIAEANGWRAQTMTLLEKSPTYNADKASAVFEVGKKIDYMTSKLSGLEYSEARLGHLRRIVEAAANLATDLGKQTVLCRVILDKPGTTFDAESMEDVLQDRSGDVLQGRPIQSVVFPSVKRWGDESGKNYDKCITIMRAQVLV